MNRLNDRLNQKMKPIRFYAKHPEDKYSRYLISGRKDASYKNWVFKAKPHEKYGFYYFDIEVSFLNEKKYVFNDVLFQYRGKEILQALQKDSPIAFGFVKKKDGENRTYYQFQVTFDLAVVSNLQTDVSNGTIGVDVNNEHLDISEIDRNGNLLNYFTIPYEVGTDRKKNETSLKHACNQIATYAKSKNKIIIIEDLDLTNVKRNSSYKSKNLNRIVHSLPYSRFVQMIKYESIKYGIDVKLVSPAYTSKIGYLKYASPMKLNTHIAASFVIARRGLGIQEKIPDIYKKYIPAEKKFKHNWSKWHFLYQFNAKLQKEKEERIHTKECLLYDGNEKVPYLTKENVRIKKKEKKEMKALKKSKNSKKFDILEIPF